MAKIIIIFLTLIGVLGTLLPGLPGTPVIALTAVGYGFIDNFQIISFNLILILFGLSLLAETLEYIISGIGARRYGASKYGILGMVLGGFIGLISMGPPGVLIGILLGSIIIEVILGKELVSAIKMGFGALLGIIGGSIFSFLIALLMAGLLLSKVI